MTKQPAAMQLADELEKTIDFQMRAREAATELRRLHRHEVATKEWTDKTEWVQTSAQVMELGAHRADVIRTRMVEMKAAIYGLLNMPDYDGTASTSQARLDIKHRAQRALNLAP